MEFETYIVLEKGTNLKRLKSGDGTYSYTVGGKAYFPVGKAIPIISLDECTCIGIANIEVVTIRAESSTVYFRIISTQKSPQVYNVWMIQSGATDAAMGGAHFGIPTGHHTFRDQRDYDDEDELSFNSDDMDRILRGLR